MRGSPSRRDVLKIAASAPLALAALGARAKAVQQLTKLPLVVLFLSGGVSSKESWNPDPKATPAELRGPLGTVATKTPGVHFSDVWPKLASRSDQFSLIRSLDTGSPEHTPSQQTAVLLDKKTVSEVAGERLGSVPYVLLNPGSSWPGLKEAFRMEQSFAPVWDAQQKCFTAPPAKPQPGLANRRQLLRKLDTKVQDGRMTGFQEKAFDLLQGGGAFFKALDLPRKDRARYGNTLAGDMVLTARRFVESGAGAVTVYHEPEAVAWDLHANIEEGMKKLAPEMDHAAATLLDEISKKRLECVVLLMGEFSRTPAINSSAGRDHWSQGNCAILAGGNIKPGVVHGKTNVRGQITEGRVAQKTTLANTVLQACGVELPATAPRVREVLR